jgi:hypothetical protein
MEELGHGAFCSLMVVYILEALERAEVAPASVFQIGDRELWELWLVGERLVGMVVLVVDVCR